MGGHLPGEKGDAGDRQDPEQAAGAGCRSARPKFPEIDDQGGSESSWLDQSAAWPRRGGPSASRLRPGRIEKDLEFCVYAEPDFITIDGRGGATGASPMLVRDATSVPTVYALYRARKYLDSVHSDISLVITGGLRVSSDFAKALAMGADAVAVASAALIAAACQQYRICGAGNCPVGVATQKPELRARLKVEAAAARVANFFNVSLEELKTFARITGHERLHDLSVDDLCTISREISEYTSIRHA